MAKGDKPIIGGKPEVTAIMQAFHDYTGLKPMPEFRQRQYASNLYKMFGDKTMEIVAYAIKIQEDDYFAPQVLSPKDMYYKLDRVMAYYRKNEGNNGRVLKI